MATVGIGRVAGTPRPVTTGRAGQLIVSRDKTRLAKLRLCADGTLVERKAACVCGLTLSASKLSVQRRRLVVEVTASGATVHAATKADLIELALERIDRGVSACGETGRRRCPATSEVVRRGEG